jgi:hypothetical protein
MSDFISPTTLISTPTCTTVVLAYDSATQQFKVSELKGDTSTLGLYAGMFLPSGGKITWKTDVQSDLVVRFTSALGWPLSSKSIGGLEDPDGLEDWLTVTAQEPNSHLHRWHVTPVEKLDLQVTLEVTETTNGMTSSNAKIIVLPRRKTAPPASPPEKFMPPLRDRPPRQGR